MRYYLVQAVVRTKYGTNKTTPRIVVGRDPIEAVRACFDDHFSGKAFEKFRVWAQRTPESFREDIGALRIDDDYWGDMDTPLEAVGDMFEPTPIEVRL